MRNVYRRYDEDDRQRLYESMYQLEYQPGEDIVKQGEDGRNFYVVVEGSLAVNIKKEGSPDINKKLFPGDTFGEVALLHSVPRSATVASVGLYKFIPVSARSLKAPVA
jgi:cAMP-dependent protein kinase regulator